MIYKLSLSKSVNGFPKIEIISKMDKKNIAFFQLVNTNYQHN